MKLSLRVGLPLLGLLLLGVALSEGGERLVLVVLAMGVALWSAFSLPHPGPRPEPPGLLEPGDGDPADMDGDSGEPGPDGDSGPEGPGRPS